MLRKAKQKLLAAKGTYCSSWKLETCKPKCFLVKGQGVGTASSSAKLSDQSICECSTSLLERHHGRKNFLLILHHQDFNLEHALNCGRDLPGRQTVGAVQDPHGLGHRHHAHKTGICQAQAAFNNFSC